MTARPTSPIEQTEYDPPIELLRELIRIPSVNPPGNEIEVARHLEGLLASAGLLPEVFEPFPGRGSIVCRVRGDGTGGDPLLLISHLDVVPADPAGWSHDPFAADLEDGYVWGRGAVDMKAMVAMEVAIMLRFAARARDAGLDPAFDPIPGLRRDVVFVGAADEEAGGWQGMSWLVEHHPELLHAAGALNEAGALRLELGGARFYPIQVAEKGFVVYTLTVHGRWGHGSVPTEDNAAVLAARIVDRLTVPGPARLTQTMSAAVAAALPHLPVEVTGRREGSNGCDATRVAAALERLCAPALARVGQALLHDTVSPDVIRAGVKYNVIPGTAQIELDCRVLPGTTAEAMTDELRRRIGEELWPRVEVHVDQVGAAVEALVDTPLYRILEGTIRDADPEAVPIPAMVPYATDAKHLAKIGVQCYGFSPLAMPVEEFLTLMHGDDERVSVEAVRWGYAVLAGAVERFCG